MTKRYVALLRAVNVGGTGKLEMAALRRLAEGCGFTDVSTYIASGNLLFACDCDEAEVKALLGDALQRHAGKPLGVLVRTADEVAAVLPGRKRSWVSTTACCTMPIQDRSPCENSSSSAPSMSTFNRSIRGKPAAASPGRWQRFGSPPCD